MNKEIPLLDYWKLGFYLETIPLWEDKVATVKAWYGCNHEQDKIPIKMLKFKYDDHTYLDEEQAEVIVLDDVTCQSCRAKKHKV